MTLLIECEFDNGWQTLIKVDATDGDARVLRNAQHGDPDVVLRVVCRLTEDGPDRQRLIRAGCIRNVIERRSGR
jgi:hypothetical protein